MGKFLIPGVLIGVGLVVAIFGVLFGYVIFPVLLESQITKTVQLKADSDAWEDWAINPVPVYLKFYLWHVENPDAIELKEMPNLTEKGPYVFSQLRAKQVKEVDEDSDTVTYEQNITYYFEPSLSIDKNGNQLSLSDPLNIVNLPFITFSTTIFEMRLGAIGQYFIREIIAQKESFVRKDTTAGEALFEGWIYPDIYKPLLVLSELLTGESQPQFEGGRFGYYRGSNQSTDGEYVMRTGLNKIAQLGEIISYNGLPSLTYWDNPTDQTHADKFPDKKYCNALNGTDGGIFPPFLTKESIVPIFSSDICRSVMLVYEGEEEHREIKGYKYANPPSFYEHPDVNPDNYCFCRSPEHPALESRCAKGLIRLFSCRGSPLVTSSPHFYEAEVEFKDKIHGMQPEKALHETYLLLQPDGGFPLKIRKRIQMSMEIQNYNNSFHPHFNDIDYIMLPALWASEEIDLDEELADELKNSLLKPVKIVNIAQWVIMAVGLVVAIGGIIFFMKRRSSGKSV